MWTSINNRTLGAGWPNYMMNCEGTTWTNTVKEMCERLGFTGVTPGNASHPVKYERLLFDVFLGVLSGHHNVIRPFELVTDQLCRGNTVANLKSICADFAGYGAHYGIICNTADLSSEDMLVENGQAVPGFAGFMDENFTDDGNGELRLANMLWKFRGHPYLHNIVTVSGVFDVNLSDRIQAVVGYLLTRNPAIPSGQEARETFGFGEWREPPMGKEDDLPIFPEQFVNAVMGQGGDPFAQTVWPPYDDGTADDWSSKITSDVTAVQWLRSVTLNPDGTSRFIRVVNGRDFAVGVWELDDGLPNVANLVAVSWDAAPGFGTTTLAELFSESSVLTWHKLVGDTRAVIDGGIVTTTPVGSTSELPTERGVVNVYFTADVHSPVIAAAAENPIPAGSGRFSELKIAASHWNGQPLQLLRVAGNDMGWGDSVELQDSDRDGIYTCSVTNGPGATPGIHTLRALAIGNDGLRTYTYVDVEAVTVPDISIASTATYPLLARSQDGKVVLAVGVTSYVPLSAATPVEVVAPTIFGSSTPVVLRDDGPPSAQHPNSEDGVAGDGIFTSDRVPGSVSNPGTLAAHIVVHPVAGASVSRDIPVEAVAINAEFVDVTGDAGAIAAFPDAPRYAMAYGNTSSDHRSGRKMLIVTFDDEITRPQILESRSVGGSSPQFVDKASEWLVETTGLPPRSRGVCFGDVAGAIGGGADGKDDFFLCGATASHLYVNVGTVDAPLYQDQIGGAFSTTDQAMLAGAVAATWRDFEPDGDLDLYVATSNYSGRMSEVRNQSGATFGGAFFVNDGNGHFANKNVTIPPRSDAGLAGAWADLRHTGRYPYLVLPWVSGGNLMVAYTMDPGSMPLRVMSVTGEPLSNLNSIAVCDFDHDAFPDLLVTDAGGGGKAAILRNDYGSTGNLAFHVARTLGTGRMWTGATVADFDANGMDDILLLPESGAPSLFMAQGARSDPQYTDLAFTMGLRAGATSGAVATDLGGTRLPDVCLGRTGQRMVYKNLKNPLGPPIRWIDIGLSTVGNSNASLIGAEVTVQQSGLSWTKSVDGGSGRGGQDPNSLRFYLGDDSSNVSVSVHYPSGDSDVLAGVPVDSTYLAVEDTPVTLKTGTSSDPDPTFSYELGPGTMDWVFRWRTVGIKGDQRQDAVAIENYQGYDEESLCYMGIEPGSSRVLHWGDPGVTFSIYWDGTDWVHEARWSELTCTSLCRYRFKVTSGLGNGVTTTSAQAKTIPRLDFCLPNPNQP
jgi:hypothetical protein